MTKILYLVHPQFDLGEWNLYMGLCEAIGTDNIIVFPQKKLYFGVVDDYSGGYPAILRNEYTINKRQLPQGIPPLALGEDVIGGYPNTRELPYLVTQNVHSDFSEDNIINAIRAGNFNFIVLTSSNRVCTIALARIRDRMGGLDKLPPIIYIDNGERDEFNAHWWHVFRSNIVIVFKLILTDSVYKEYKNKYGLEMYCLPQSSCLAGKDLGVILNKYHRMLYDKGVPDWVTFNDNDKVIDCYYAMGVTYDKRADLADQLKDYGKNKPNRIVVGSPAHYYGYLNNIAHSKIAVSMRGSGRDSSRYWDIPGFNTMLLCDGTMGCLHPFPFEDGKTAVFYNENELHKLPEILEYYLDNDKERERIARDGHQHLLKYHTNNARAEYFLDIVRKYGI